LVVLFEVNIIYYLLQKFLPRILTYIAAIALSIVEYIVVQNGYHLVCYLDIAFVAMPYFILGAESRRLGLLEKGPNLAIKISMAVVMIVVLFFFAQKINMLHRIYPPYLLLYALPALSIMTLLFWCQGIKRPVPVISHLGRYSIIVLGTHYSLIGPLKLIMAKIVHGFSQIPWSFLIILVIVMALEYPIIYLLRKYLPRFTAQKEFFYEGWKLRPNEKE
ncbi:MAG: hypothetical protein IKT03_03940, partial [Muribaculaceae bacterium]|nr:hypothetical protein [Muribaculaceae bacterium]